MSTEEHTKPVVRLINEIAVQFCRKPVPVAAMAIAEHIRRFWDPRMRAQLLSLQPSEADELDERAMAALATLQMSQEEKPPGSAP